MIPHRKGWFGFPHTSDEWYFRREDSGIFVIKRSKGRSIPEYVAHVIMKGRTLKKSFNNFDDAAEFAEDHEKMADMSFYTESRNVGRPRNYYKNIRKLSEQRKLISEANEKDDLWDEYLENLESGIKKIRDVYQKNRIRILTQQDIREMRDFFKADRGGGLPVFHMEQVAKKLDKFMKRLPNDGISL